MRKLITLYVLVVALLTGCQSSKNIPYTKNQLNITFLHLNDVYEISPLNGGKEAGLARVGTVREELLKENPHTLTVLAGDFLSPSVIGTLKHEGKTIAGKQMVETMNAVGVDWVVFGNHEFDLKEKDLLDRINESKFNWLNTNAFYIKDNQTLPFGKIINEQKQDFPKTKILEIDGVKIGIFGIVLPSARKPFVAYDDFFTAAKRAYLELEPQCDFVVAITHINKADDRKLAEMLPNLKLIMGGHDHDNMLEKIGNVTLAKADANARTVYVHRLSYDKKTKQVNVTSELKPITDKIADNQAVAAVVKKWETIMDDALKVAGMDKNDIVYETTVPLDGRESSVRNGSTLLTQTIVKAMSAVSASADAAIFNSGSIRIDDQLIGKISQLDLVRTLPYGGKVLEVTMKGRLLEKVLQAGIKNKGNGGYLQWDKIRQVGENFEVNGQLLDLNKNYKIVLTEFLMTGGETNLSFLNKQNPDIVSVIDSFEKTDAKNDIRKVIIDYMKSLK